MRDTFFSIEKFLRMRRDAEAIFRAGIQAVQAEAAIRSHCRCEGPFLRIQGKAWDLSAFDRIYVVGAGKASAPMARALEDLLGERIAAGWVNVKYGHGEDLHRIRIHEAGHPVPDRQGIEGTRAIYEMARGASERDLVLCVLSGGGSALLPMPVPPLHLEEKQDTTRILLECGAPIQEINAVRKHLSLLKGGGLARVAYPAWTISLILSDVVGDPLDVIASGPTAPDPTTFGDGLEVLDRYGIRERVPHRVLARLLNGMEGRASETPKPGDPIFERVQNAIIGSNFQCVSAAHGKAKELGYRSLILSSRIEGETREVARLHGAIAKEVVHTGNPIGRPACILSGGETTVTIAGRGKGGRNQEFALALALEIEGLPDVVALSGGTDGTDGPTDAAGAYVDGDTVRRAEALGLKAARFLEDNDSYRFFQGLGDLFYTGPTRTNVMDLRIMLIA